MYLIKSEEVYLIMWQKGYPIKWLAIIIRLGYNLIKIGCRVNYSSEKDLSLCLKTHEIFLTITERHDIQSLIQSQ